MQINPKSDSKRGRRQKKFKPPKKITEQYLQNAGLHYLQRFASSSANFKAVMMRKVKRSCAYHKDQDIEACEKLVDKLVEHCKELGLLNDEAYTRGMITSLRRAGKSKRVIQMKLASKGLDQEMIQDALTQFNDAQDTTELEAERQAALRFAQKRKIGPFRKESKKNVENIEQKELGALARAGFSYDVCRYILEQNKDNFDCFLET